MTDYTKQLVEQRRELHQWPEEGWLKLEISPLIQTRPISRSSSRRTV